MRYFLRVARRSLLPCILLLACSQAHSQVLTSSGFLATSVQDPKTQSVTLREVLLRLKARYMVNILFEDRLVNQPANPSLVEETATLEENLTNVLRSSGLRFKRIDDGVYLITKTKKTQGSKNQAPVNPLKKSDAYAVPPSADKAVKTLPDASERNSVEKDIDRLIDGRIIDEKGEPLPGVSIIIKSTLQGTATDDKGRFRLSLPESPATLVVSFVGYVSQEITVTNQTQLEITLKVDQKALDEVVVVGYGTQSKRNITGSVAKVDMKQTENLPNTNVTQSLRGRVAGVQFIDNGRPGQNGSILIRGPRSLTASNNPLIVLDGIFFNGNLADINPNDIESMEVLKDASASAIYGSRAANGVLLITSKKGKSETPTIRVNVFQGFSDWAHRMELLTPERYVQKTLDYRTQAGLPNNPNDIVKYLTSNEAANYSANKTIDPWDVVSQKARTRSFDLNVSGQSSRSNYLISASWMEEKGLILNDNIKRLTLRSNVENRIADWLTMGTNATFVTRDYSGVEASTANAYYTSPFATIYHDDGYPREFTIDGEIFSSSPVRAAILTKNEEKYNNLFANFYATVQVPFVKGLSYRVNYSPNYRWNHNYNFFPQDKYLTNNTTSASKYNRQDFDWVLENIVTYDRQINENHSFDLTFLYGRNHFGWESTQANASQLSSEVLGWNNLGLGGTLTNSSNAQASDGLSSMARLNYRFRNKYLVSLTARRDGSSVFAANNKYATFPSAAFAWIASDERFLKGQTWLDLLKVRLSYGAVGNQAIGPYQSLNLSSTNRYVFGDGGASQIGVFPSNMANADLKWETTYTTNVAVDFELFKKRVGGTVELYEMTTRDLIVRRTIPLMTGYASVLTNLGATDNKGIEFSINTLNISKNQLEWSSNFVFSANRNKIVHLYRSDSNKDGKEDDDLGNRWFIGKPVSVAYDYNITGIFQTSDEIPAGNKPGYVRLEDLNGDGKIDATNDRKVLGQMEQPKFRWGVTNTLKYKNLTFSAFVNVMQGWVTQFDRLDYSGINSISSNFPFRATNMLDADWWTDTNPSKSRPSLVYPNSLGHNWYVSRDFVRLQDVSVSYEMPAQLLRKIRVQSLRVSLAGKNLYTFTKFPGMDPEIGYSSTYFPLSRTFSAGLNLGF